jgi:hypothetical protein
VAANCRRRFTEELHGATSQKTAFFIVSAVKNSKPHYLSVQFNAETLFLLWLQAETFEIPVAIAVFRRPAGGFLGIFLFVVLARENMLICTVYKAALSRGILF